MSDVVFYDKAFHACPHCTSTIILNGPVLKTRCDACFTPVEISADFWKHLLTIQPNTGVFIYGQRISPEPGILKNPRCRSCGEKLTCREVPSGNEGVLVCGACGTEHDYYPAPEWLAQIRKDKLSPDMVFCAEREYSAESPEPASALPVAFYCISCGAGLMLDADTPRIMSCGYCRTRQYLPGALWHAMHPVKKLSAWYIRYQ